MKMRLFLVVLLPFFVMSCSEKASDLTVTYTGSNTMYLIPSSTQSCYTQNNPDDVGSADISSKYFQIKNPTFTWVNTDADLYLIAIKVTISASQLNGGSYTGVISGDELASLNNTYGKWDGKIARATVDTTTKAVIPTVVPSSANSDATLKNPFCSLKYGAVSIVNGQDVDFQATGVMQIIGVQRNDAGEEVPVTITTPFTVSNIGLQI